jgi:hypothetical protein
MRKLVVAAAVAVVFCAGPAFSQAPVQIGPNDAIGLDYVDADFASYAVTEFNAQYDAGTWTSIGVPTNKVTAGGVTTYKVVPPQTNGNHTVSFRACNVAGCSAGTVPFAFAPVLSAPVGPTNVRKVPR